MRRTGTITGGAGLPLVGLGAALATQAPAEAGMIRTIMLGQNPTPIATDSRTARTFVLDQGSLARSAAGPS